MATLEEAAVAHHAAYVLGVFIFFMFYHGFNYLVIICLPQVGEVASLECSLSITEDAAVLVAVHTLI